MCKESGCKKYPSFNIRGEKTPLYCFEHKTPLMIDLKHKTCRECNVRAAFANAGDKTPLYCVTHKQPNMVDVVHKTCLECNVRAVYNQKGEKKGLYCSFHKKDNMVDVLTKTCLECDTKPVYNQKGEKKGLYCVNHKKQHMVDVVSKMCIENNCNKQPIYNLEGETMALYCASHKKENMVNVKNKICIESNCKTQPSYNKIGEKTALYCRTHRKEGMIDVHNKICLKCTKLACFNKKGEKRALFCNEHKETEMINIYSQTCLKCDVRPVFNTIGQKNPLYCATHKLSGMVDVKSKTCKSELCFTQVRDKYDGYCMRCYMNLFPDKPVFRNYKTKEYAVVEHVKTKFKDFTWVADRKVSDGCSRRRPDLLLDLGDQVIVIEVDENQHTDYDCSCENKRTMELSQDLGHRPIVFIRFNPDNYKKDGTSVTSCWGLDKTGICVVKKSKKTEWVERLKCLEEQVTYWINPENRTDKTVEIVQLFYDNWSGIGNDLKQSTPQVCGFKSSPI